MMTFTEFDQFLDKPDKASFLYNVIVDVHFLPKSQDFMVISLLLWWSHWPAFLYCRRWTVGKKWQEYFYYWLKYLETKNLEFGPLCIYKKTKSDSILYCQCYRSVFCQKFELIQFYHFEFTFTHTHTHNLLLLLTWIKYPDRLRI